MFAVADPVDFVVELGFVFGLVREVVGLLRFYVDLMGVVVRLRVYYLFLRLLRLKASYCDLIYLYFQFHPCYFQNLYCNA